eukprot:28884-Rhodomonas_salina.2
MLALPLFCGWALAANDCRVTDYRITAINFGPGPQAERSLFKFSTGSPPPAARGGAARPGKRES